MVINNMKTATQVMEDNLCAEMSQQIAKEIDFDILKGVLIQSCGWHYVQLDTLGSNKRAIDIGLWAHTECTGNWKHLGRSWLFEREEDAILFKLTWS